MNFRELIQKIVQEISKKSSKNTLSSQLMNLNLIFVFLFIYRALIINCQNALYPDHYGHYREASFTQTKHHWWWKANRVFDQLDITRYHTGVN